MRRVGHLFEKIVDFHALWAATKRASAGRRAKPAVAAFLFSAEREVLRLRRELTNQTYRPGPFTRFVIRDPKRRTINAPMFRDRVVHHSVCAALEPVFERVAIFDSYACRRGKGAHAAVDRAQLFARRAQYFLKLDIAKFYDSIDHQVLEAQVRRLVKDQDALRLLDTIIEHAPPGAPRGKSLAIGNLTSQHLSNLYLSPLDHFIKEQLRARFYLRYMDDLLLLGDSKEEMWDWREAIERYAAEHLLLTLKDRATVLAPVSEGIPFLGLRLWPGVRRLDPRRMRRFCRKLRRLDQALDDPRADPDQTLDSLNALMASVSIADTHRLRQSLISMMMDKEGRSR
jgi:hypothetical protein